MTEQHGNIHPGEEAAQVHHIKRDLTTRGCPVCDHLNRQIFDLFSSLQYRLGTLPDESRQLAEEFGFCARHTWQLATIASPRGAAAAWTPLLEKLKDVLTATAGAADPNATIAALARNRTTCRICRRHAEWEQNYVEKLAAFIATPASRAAYATSQGVCLSHLAMLLTRLSVPDDRQFVLEHAARFFAQVVENLAGFDAKYAAFHRDQLSADERDAYWRVMIHLAGSRKVCPP